MPISPMRIMRIMWIDLIDLHRKIEIIAYFYGYAIDKYRCVSKAVVKGSGWERGVGKGGLMWVGGPQ